MKRVWKLVFAAGTAATLAFGATTAVAAPEKEATEPFFCGYHFSWESCERCCGMYQATWGGECWCGPDTKM